MLGGSITFSEILGMPESVIQNSSTLLMNYRLELGYEIWISHTDQQLAEQIEP